MNNFSQTKLIARAVFLELLRKRDLYVVFLLMGVFVIGALFVNIVGIENAATATFLLNLGLTLAYYAAHILTLLLAARQLPNEIENRTLYPLLAKPVERRTVLLGKWAACSLAGIGVFLALGLVGVLPVPRRETFDNLLLMQAFVLIPCSLALLSALAIALSLLFTRGITLLILGLLLALGGQWTGIVEHTVPGDAARRAVHLLLLYVPDFSRFNLITRYTDGIGALAGGEWLGMILYAVIFTAAALALAARTFERRAL
jgi:ABC-type transport system involved in multi-copper enzyme maturation permease subunit